MDAITLRRDPIADHPLRWAGGDAGSRQMGNDRRRIALPHVGVHQVRALWRRLPGGREKMGNRIEEEDLSPRKGLTAA